MFLMSYFRWRRKMRPHPQLVQARAIPDFVKRDRSFSLQL